MEEQDSIVYIPLVQSYTINFICLLFFPFILIQTFLSICLDSKDLLIDMYHEDGYLWI